MQKLVSTAVITLCFLLPVTADISLKGQAILQATRKSEPAHSANLDESFVRAETYFKGTHESGVDGLIHLRFQAGFGSGTVSTTIRQVWFKFPVGKANILAGRWYEYYSPGAYFGRWLYESKPLGSGNFCTTYSVLDGVKFSIPLIEKAKTDLQISLLSSTPTFTSTYAAAMVSSTPIEALNFKIGANFQLAEPSGDNTHKLMANATYTIMKNFSVFAEYGATNMAEMADNSHLLAGLEVPTFGVVDRLWFEVEYGSDRPEGVTPVGWMVLINKKFANVLVNLGIGEDPSGLGSIEANDIGGHIRITANF